jgi:hypothetical protein
MLINLGFFERLPWNLEWNARLPGLWVRVGAGALTMQGWQQAPSQLMIVSEHTQMGRLSTICCLFSRARAGLLL